MTQAQASAPKKSGDAPVEATPAHYTVVINNRESLIIGPLPPTGKDTSGVPMLGANIILIPGLNLVPTAQLVELKKNPTFANLFTEKIGRHKATEHNTERVGSPILLQVPGELPRLRPFALVDPKECAEYISEIFSTKMLEEWLHDEQRDGVRLELQRQITRIRTGETIEDRSL